MTHSGYGKARECDRQHTLKEFSLFITRVSIECSQLSALDLKSTVTDNGLGFLVEIVYCLEFYDH